MDFRTAPSKSVCNEGGGGKGGRIGSSNLTEGRIQRAILCERKSPAREVEAPMPAGFWGQPAGKKEQGR
jgi:hypothetical protein